LNRYFIYQFAAFGDCLFATIVVKQLKYNDPDCEITWGISKRYVSILKNNPYVDRILEFEIDPKTATPNEFDKHNSVINNLEKEFGSNFIHLQLLNKHIHHLFTTLRYTVIKVFGGPITVSRNAVLYLDQKEKDNVKEFIFKNEINTYSTKILFECAPSSGQSTVDYKFALQVAEKIIAKNKNVCIVLSGAFSIEVNSPQIFNANSISYRENLELINYCDLLIGCSSGISWLTICESAKPIPMIQLLSSKSDLFAGVHFDFEINNLDNSHILEMINFDVIKTVECIEAFLKVGILETKLKFHQEYKPSIFNLKNNVMKLVWQKFPILELRNYIERYLEENRFLKNEIQLNFIDKWLIILKSQFNRYLYKSKQIIINYAKK
jgi:ADP-heptose:LPS heptosyltransferase